MLSVEGTATLGGTLDLSFIDGFCPAIGDKFAMLNFGSYIGEFSSIDVLDEPSYGFAAQYTSTGISLVTTSVPEPATISLFGLGAILLIRARTRH